MIRPLMRHRIDELEAFFQTSREDADGLRNLEIELTFRQAPRAMALLVKVRKLLGGGGLPAPKQHDLFSDAVPAAPAPPRPSKALAKLQAAQAVPQNSFPPAQAASASDIESAYKALRVSRAATWEVIETSRREIVDHARPDAVSKLDSAEREALRREAARANAAYLVIARTKAQ